MIGYEGESSTVERVCTAEELGTDEEERSTCI